MMSDKDRGLFGQDDRRPLDRTADVLDGRDDPNRGPLDRAENVLEGRDDPNRGPLDRAANAITGGTGGVSSAMTHDDPNRGPLDRTSNALEGRDDPHRGPLDRTTNAFDGRDDPNRGPLDRAANVIAGGAGGVSAAFGGNDGPSSTDGIAGTNTVSALFDSEADAQGAVAELRTAGIRDDDLSLIAQNRDGTVTRSGDNTVVDEDHGSFLRGIFGGGALGAGLGVAALAIPGVGPLVGLGAIAATAVPSAMAAGAAFGAAAGTWNEMLAKHGIDEQDAAYYHQGMTDGGILVTVQPSGADAAQVRDILFRNGGHTASRSRTGIA